MAIKVGKASLDKLRSSVAYFGVPMNVQAGTDEKAEQAGLAEQFRITTTDDLDIVISVIQWPSASPEVKLTDWIDGLSKYERLKSAGRLGVLTEFGSDWLAELRVLKYADRDSRPTLVKSTWEELAEMLEGDPKALLLSNGAIEVGTREELGPDLGPRRSQLAMRCPDGDCTAMAVAFTLTRVLPIMYDFGLPEEEL
jgi:hypothetical protein